MSIYAAFTLHTLTWNTWRLGSHHESAHEKWPDWPDTAPRPVRLRKLPNLQIKQVSWACVNNEFRGLISPGLAILEKDPRSKGLFSTFPDKDDLDDLCRCCRCVQKRPNRQGRLWLVKRIKRHHNKKLRDELMERLEPSLNGKLSWAFYKRKAQNWRKHKKGTFYFKEKQVFDF